MIDKIKKMKIVIADVDGVLTDGSINVSDNGLLFQRFYVRDGAGIKFLLKSDIEFALITARDSQAIVKRATELGIQHIYIGIRNKLEVYNSLLAKLQLTDEQCCYIGDDLIDAPVMQKVGFACAVADAVDEVKNIADYITKLDGGKGAVREIAELILKTQNKWNDILAYYSIPTN